MTTTFSINGQPFAVNLANLPAEITLNTFIREYAGLPATKFMCQEGGCGVCVCVVTGVDSVKRETRTWAVNSCLTLLNSCSDWEITTSEGLGNKRNGYHAIQKRLAHLNGTQCGYCSPGFVMNMYGLLTSKNGKVTMDEVENAFGGNICRCTGYRPILDAMKSFAIDSNIQLPVACRDIEDLSNISCPKTGALCNGNCKTPANRGALKYPNGNKWFWPKSLQEVFDAFAQLEDDEPYILVSGNTAHGVYRRAATINTFIDVNAVPELHQHSISADSMVLGANLSLSEAMRIFEEAATKPGFEYCAKLWQHFDLIGNAPVRNMGSLAGNLVIKHQHKEFPSDVYIALAALNVQIVINETKDLQRTHTLEEYMKLSLRKKVLKALVLRAYPSDQYIFDSYKIMPRAQNAHALVNAAFLINVQAQTYKVKSARICFGGINPGFTHASAVEDLLADKKLFEPQIVSNALRTLQGILRPDAELPDASPEYRQRLACNLFYKFLLCHAPPNSVSARNVAGGKTLKRPISSGKQTFATVSTEQHNPIHQPTDKLEGLMQAAGEAIYANDLPPQPQQLWAAFVTAKKIGATVTDIDATEALKLPGVVALFTAKDIPGNNTVVCKDEFFFLEEEPLFPTDAVQFYDQPIGVIVAESNALANRAAELVKITYSGGSAAILPTLNSVLHSASTDRIRHEIKSAVKDLEISESFDVKAAGQLDLGLQFHFFMEPHTTIVLPQEGVLQVYSATQWMDLVQSGVANFLGLKSHEVQVKVRRIGGGYGGKATRCNPVACAAALAAYKLNRPVRFVQTLESMMSSLGKRWACLIDYEFYVKSSGKIVALRSTFYEDAGYNINESPMQHTALLSKNCYEFSDNFKLDGHMVLTDSPSNTPCRAPGSVEGIAMIESIIEHIAFATQVDSAEVRLANILPGHKMEELLPRFLETTEYQERRRLVRQFNSEQRWLKRGLGLCVMEYHIGYFGQFPATLAVYHSDGTVVISHGGVEMGQGMNTKIAQVAAHHLGVSMALIRIEGSDTVNGANSMVTGGSIGSETLCFAVRKCCNILNDRLKPIKEELKDANWQQLVAEAYNRKVNLIVSDDCKAGDMDPYTVCALGLSEVEVDILTGNYLIKRVDILEDTGVSLNPNVDIGQIEGAFMMGLGYWISEQIVVDSGTGEVKTNRTWNYKPPGAKDIPIDFRIELLPQSSNAAGFMRSKATGEPAICLPIGVAFALQQALQSARDDAGQPRMWVPLVAPMTPEYVMQAAGTDIDMLHLA